MMTTCQYCKKIFTNHPSEDRKYCSKKCYGKNITGKPNLINKGKPAWNKGICHLSSGAKKLISEARKKWYKTHEHPKGMKGKLHTQEDRDKIAAGLLKGRKRVSKVPQGYQYGHLHVRLIRGKPLRCIFCRKHKKNHPKLIFDWANLTKDYHNPNDYIPACRLCHKRFDKKLIKLP